MAEIRIPKQKRSIEKKEKIIMAANQVFMEKGYFNISTVDIVNASGLSVGVFYSYFTDKKDVLLACLDRFGGELTENMCNGIESIPDSDDIEDVLIRILSILVGFHSKKHLYHNEVKALEYLDEDVKEQIKKMKNAMMDSLLDKLSAYGYYFPYKEEQVFLIYQMIEGIEEETASQKSEILDQDILLIQCTHIIRNMLLEEK